MNPPSTPDNIPGDMSPNGDRIGSRELQRIVDDVLKKGAAPEKTYREELVEKANAVTFKVNDHFMREVKPNIIPTKHKDAVDKICDLYLQEYRTWSIDDLRENLALMQACYHAESIRNLLI